MNIPELDTLALNQLLDRARQGDELAWDDLLRRSSVRLERLARKMLRGFPAVHRWEDTADVLQNVMIRFVRSLKAVDPGSTKGYYCLAAEQIRRELIDLARHYQGPMGHGRNYGGAIAAGTESTPGLEPADIESDVDELDRWAAFHQAVESLPAEERETLMLVFYNGWAHKQVAELFDVDERTIRRRYRAAVLRLSESLGDQLPRVAE